MHMSVLIFFLITLQKYKFHMHLCQYIYAVVLYAQQVSLLSIALNTFSLLQKRELMRMKTMILNRLIPVQEAPEDIRQYPIFQLYLYCDAIKSARRKRVKINSLFSSIILNYLKISLNLFFNMDHRYYVIVYKNMYIHQQVMIICGLINFLVNYLIFITPEINLKHMR